MYVLLTIIRHLPGPAVTATIKIKTLNPNMLNFQLGTMHTIDGQSDTNSQWTKAIYIPPQIREMNYQDDISDREI